MIPGLAWPAHTWPVRAWPEFAWPEDARAYRLYRLADPDDDPASAELVAELAPGIDQVTIEGEPDSEAWYFPRAVSRLGREDDEPVMSKLKRIAFDAAGELIEPVPNAPIGLVVEQLAGGAMRAAWSYESYRQAIAPAIFNVYVATAATPIDFDAAPAHQVSATGRRRYTADLGTFGHDTLVRIVVRAASATGAEEPNTTEAEATADAEAPAAPNAITTEVETQ